MVALPRLLQTPSPNVSSRGGARVRLVVLHDTEGSYAGAISWFSQCRSRVSAHLVMREDGAEATQMAPLGEKAWHACKLNPVSIGVEGAGIEAEGFSNGWWLGMAAIAAWLLHRYGLPCRWAEGGEGEGFCSHHDLAAAGGGHDDPTAVGSTRWTRFIALVEAAYRDFGGAPLPDWALHGLPAPSSVSLPAPALPDANSHGGRAGADPDEPALPVTGAPHPVGSVADIQQRLNQTGVRPPLEVDGFAGPRTRQAIRAFQSARGIAANGELGPIIWAALERAS